MSDEKRCQRCRKWFVKTPGKENVSCCVAHALDDCCHFSDTEVPEPTHGTDDGEKCIGPHQSAFDCPKCDPRKTWKATTTGASGTAPPQPPDPSGLCERLKTLMPWNANLGFSNQPRKIIVSMYPAMRDELLAYIQSLESEIRDRADTEQSLTQWVEKLGTEKDALVADMREIAKEPYADSDPESLLQTLRAIAQRHIEGANDGKD